VGDAIAAELEAQVAEAFSYDADDPRFDAEAAATLEREATGIRRGPALRAECAAPSYENGGVDISAEDVADAKRSVKLQKVAHPDDGVVPEALVYGGPVLDRALALVFTFALQTGLVPADWLSERARAADETGADDGRDADVDGGQAPSADGDDRASDGGSDTEPDVEGPDSTEARRAWDADVRRRSVEKVAEREAKLFARDDDGNFVLLKTAALWREIAEPDPNGVQYASLRYWMRTCVFSLTADETGTALVALLCGCWWAAPAGRQLVRGVGVPSTCAACGSRSMCLAVHLLLGKCDGEAACSCPEAGEVREQWEEEVDDLYTAHADSYPEEVAEYMTAPPRSLRRVALMIGRASGVELPWSLASELPRVFSRTWGAWSRLALARAARAAAG